MNNTTKNIINELIGVNREYITMYPKQHQNGHGESLSVKIVLPCYCQAHCSFCFNNLTSYTQKHDYEKFLSNLTNTLDITGNEPTFDIENFSKFVNIIKRYKDKAEKIVLTTNGFNLDKCLNDVAGIIDIVNLSVHHYDYSIRQYIFGTQNIPNDKDIEYIIKFLKNRNTMCTAVVVLNDELENFNEFYNNFISWSINLGFKDVRMRSNFCIDTEYIDKILNIKMKNENLNEEGALTTKIITDEETGFKTYILKGVPDLTEYVIGAELVIDDDGLCYIDYNKRYSVNDSNINYFNNFYIFNDKDLDSYKEKNSFQNYKKKR